MACGLNAAHCLFWLIKFYWNTDSLTHKHIVSACFYVTTTKLSNCDRDCEAHKA